ncbi:hypothetical protein BKA63DRAFT_110131 [Paraphoma chrysanthemicola]|nr:hypothetical protein BKA63DRAFT_110131 [Paraphoma chrysanthemicola]
MTLQVWLDTFAETSRMLPSPVRDYFASTPFLPLVHSFNTLIIAAAAYTFGHKVSIDICAFQQVLNADKHYRTASTRLFCSTIWTTVIILDNAERTTNFPWFTLGTFEGKCMLFINIFAGLFMALQVVIRFLSVEHRSPAAQEELDKALNWFYDTPAGLDKDFRRSPSRLAMWMHCIIVLQPLVLLFLPRLRSRSEFFASFETLGAVGKWLGLLCLAFGLCVLEAMVLLVTAEVYQSGEGAFDARVHSGMYATCMHGALLGKFLTKRFNWFMWVASDALLWSVGNWWEHKRRETVLRELVEDIVEMKNERDKNKNRLCVVSKAQMMNGKEGGMNSVIIESV